MHATVLSISVQDQYHGTAYEEQKCLHNLDYRRNTIISLFTF